MAGIASLLLAAFGLMLVFEGFLPLVAPRAWRDAFERLITLRDGQVRFLGLSAVVLGSVVLWIAA